MIKEPMSLVDLAINQIGEIYTQTYCWFHVVYCGACPACELSRSREQWKEYSIFIYLDNRARHQGKDRILYPDYRCPYSLASSIKKSWTVIELIRGFIKDWRINPYLHDRLEKIFPYYIVKTCNGPLLVKNHHVVQSWYYIPQRPKDQRIITKDYSIKLAKYNKYQTELKKKCIKTMTISIKDIENILQAIKIIIT